MSTFIVRTPDGEVTTKSSTTAKKIYRLSGRRLSVNETVTLLEDGIEVMSFTCPSFDTN